MAAMSTKIRLYFREQVIPDYKELGILAIRLMCRMSFQTQNGFTDPYPAIVDTGAPISLIPLQIWRGCGIEAETIRDSTIRGVVPLEECQLAVTLAEVKCKVVGTQHESDILSVKAHLASTDAVPLILGFKNLLDRVPLHVDYQKSEAFIEVGSK
jgi:hypothetical protein